jgi:hypothetical protein
MIGRVKLQSGEEDLDPSFVRRHRPIIKGELFFLPGLEVLTYDTTLPTSQLGAS